jgi:hypothetical protein
MSRDKFDHPKHASLFSSCDGCHTIQPDEVSFPDPALCQGCHNGQIAREVDWPGPVRRANKYGFNHTDYMVEQDALGEELACGSCHTTPGGGTMDVRRAPPTHTPFFLNDHRALGASATAECETCHNRDQRCYGCHTGSENLDTPSQEQSSYHPANFMQQHSAAAWSRETECASCHNPEAFCRACHLDLGRAGNNGRTDTGYHNENPNWQFGHGQAARQGLESCASCHAQADCLQCHSAKGGRNINPHGPDFDAEKLKSKNERLCLMCHYSGQVGL